MIDGGTYAKPRRAGRGFARFAWRQLASSPYADGMAGAMARVPFRPVAVDGAAGVIAAFRGGK